MGGPVGGRVYRESDSVHGVETVDIRGYAVGEAGLVAPFACFRIILVGAAGYLASAGVPTSNALGGAAVIIVSTLYIAEREARRSPGEG